MKIFLVGLFHEEDGQAMVEYALLAALVALVSWPALNAIRPALKAAYLRWNQAELDSMVMPPPK